jgi:hypothetical protein
MKDKVSFLPSFSKRDVFDNMLNRINYLTRLKDITEGFKAKHALIDARAKHIRNQNMLNYQGEYDRIIHALNHTAAPGLSRDMLKSRRKELEKLGVKAVAHP